MAIFAPEEFAVVENLENDLNQNLTTRGKFFSIKQNKTMKQIREHAESSLFKPDEVYATINDVTQCGVFCNR
jgi:hypothetical protein